MPRRKRGERYLGPYSNRGGVRWLVVEVAATGERTPLYFATEADAREFLAEFEQQAQITVPHDTETAWVEYEKHLKAEGNKPGSIMTTKAAVTSFFPKPVPLHLLTARRCERLYADLCARKSERTKELLSVDTRRNRLAEVKTFLRWCHARSWIPRNPAEGIHGTGKRRPRGKSLGKSGHELRRKEARALFAKALELAQAGDAGATCALTAMLLGMRASEITTRTVRDLDEEDAPGDLLWIPCAKTPAGRRTLEVPEDLRPLLLAQAEGKGPNRYLFEAAQPSKARPGGTPHWRDWPRLQIHRICDLAEVPHVTAHAMRGLLATLTREHGIAGHIMAAQLGHRDERVGDAKYAAPGSADAGTRKRGLKVLKGGK